MTLSEIPAAFQSKLRLAVVAALVREPLTFAQLREVTGATDGNLGRQLELLAEDGIISDEKAAAPGRKGRSFCLTKQGREQFTEYVELLKTILTQGLSSDEFVS